MGPVVFKATGLFFIFYFYKYNNFKVLWRTRK